MNKYILPLYNRLDIAFIKGKKSLLFDENKKDYCSFEKSIEFYMNKFRLSIIIIYCFINSIFYTYYIILDISFINALR